MRCLAIVPGPGSVHLPIRLGLSFLGSLQRHTGTFQPVSKGHQGLKITAAGSEALSGYLLAFRRSTWSFREENFISWENPKLQEPNFEKEAAARDLTCPLPKAKGLLALLCEGLRVLSMPPGLHLSPHPLSFLTFTGEGERD